MKRAVLMCVTSLFLLAHAARSLGDPPTATETSQNLAPCQDPAYRQFDFWTGDWDVFEVERPAVIVARARVELMLNRCALHEVYEGLDGHRGESFSLYDSTRNTWHQSWVNDRGYLLTIEGRLQGKAMIIEGLDHLPNGKLCQVRGEWRPDAEGAHEVAWRSTDGGVSWVQWFDLLFRPHASSAKTSALIEARSPHRVAQLEPLADRVDTAHALLAACVTVRSSSARQLAGGKQRVAFASKSTGKQHSQGRARIATDLTTLRPLNIRKQTHTSAFSHLLKIPWPGVTRGDLR